MKSKVSFPPELPIWMDQERMRGAPCFKGTRAPVDSFLECFPEVTREQAVAVLDYAHKSVFQSAA
jgi:uncharacterized protein (DUF433 family)